MAANNNNMSDTDIHPRPSLTATSTPLNLHQRGDNTTNILQLEVQNKKAGLIRDDMRKAVYNHIVRVLLDGAPDGTLDCMLRRMGCTDLVKFRHFIRQPHYPQWLDTQEIYLTDDQYQGLHGLESNHISITYRTTVDQSLMVMLISPRMDLITS